MNLHALTSLEAWLSADPGNRTCTTGALVIGPDKFFARLERYPHKHITARSRHSTSDAIAQALQVAILEESQAAE